MGAFATVTIPLDVASPGAAALALEEGETSAGAVDVAVTADGLTLKQQLPGNLGALMRRLAGVGFATPARIGVSVPIRSLGIPGVVPDMEHLVAELHASGEVFDAHISGDTVTASTRPTSKGLYRIYYELLHAGLIAQDTPTLVTLRGL